MSQQKILKFESLQSVINATEAATEAANNAAAKVIGTIVALDSNDDYITLIPVEDSGFIITESVKTTPNGYDIDIVTITY